MTGNNKILAEIFRNMADIYEYLGASERFRELAYRKAAKVLSGLENDINCYVHDDAVKDIPGIGESIESKIKEFLKTGKIRKYNELKKIVPHEILDLAHITGFGPQSLKKMHEQLHLSTKEEVVDALNDGTIAALKGFGEKKVAAMLRGLKLHKTIEERIILWDALEAGERLLAMMKQLPEVIHADLAGSLRRRKETIGDIDLLVACKENDRKKIVSKFIGSGLAKQVLVKGDTKASILLRESGRQADMRLVNEDEWGAALQYFTGSKEHNIHLRTIAKEKGFKINEYGLFTIKNDKKVAGKTEEGIYEALGYKIMPPEIREDKGEIELSAKNKIPELITIEDIKGDLQMHSNWSEGSGSIEEIARYIRKNFNYQYIAITDHSVSTRIANGLDEKRLLKQIKEIGKINHRLGIDFIKAGIEVDILPDGKLDITDEVLSQLDWVTASVHARFNIDNTERLIKACQNPFVNCIGHPTGRLIGKREPYKVDMPKLIEAAANTNTALEINAQKDRMDLNDEHAKLAREHGVKLVISTDSHQYTDLNYMRLGVFVARRAWCTANDILNTKSWDEIKTFVKLKRSSTKLKTHKIKDHALH